MSDFLSMMFLPHACTSSPSLPRYFPVLAARHSPSTLIYCKVLYSLRPYVNVLFIISVSFNSSLRTARSLVNDEVEWM
jgi:hypothetical protein